MHPFSSLIMLDCIHFFLQDQHVLKEAEISVWDKNNNISKAAIDVDFTYTINNNSIVSMPYSIYSSFEEDWVRDHFLLMVTAGILATQDNDNNQLVNQFIKNIQMKTLVCAFGYHCLDV